MSKKLLLNISGHPLSDVAKKEAKDRDFKTITISVPNVDVTNVESIISYLKTIYETLTKNKNITNVIRTNNFTIIPPGLSILTSSVISMLHGISGSFPNQLWLIRNDEGIFVLGDSIDLQSIRLQYRDFRNP